MAEHTEYDAREARRLRAWELKKQGWKQKDIAETLGVSKGAVSQWMKRAEWFRGIFGNIIADSVDEMKKAEWAKRELLSRPLGRRPDISNQEDFLAYLQRKLTLENALGMRQSAKDLAEEIARKFGVHYHPDHVSRLMRQMRKRRS